MADLEEVIFKLSIDGSAYTAGAESLSNSTKKLSDVQQAANAKLAELQKSQNSYKKSLEETTAVIKANEKETLELTKDLNLLKESGKGASAEAEKLKNALRGIATSTKEFKIEAAGLKDNLNNTTNQLKLQTKEVQAAEKANVGFAGGLQKTYTGLSRVAQLIPGLGIGGLVAIIAGPLVSAFQKWFESVNEVGRQTKLLSDVQKETSKNAGADIANLEILYKVATNTTLSIIERKKAVDELQAQYPDYFKNIKDEIILQGGAKDAYDKTKLAILESAKARAIDSQLTVLATQELDKEQEKRDVLAKIEKNRIEQKKADRKDDKRDAEARGLDQFTAIQKGSEFNKQLSDINKDLKDIADDRDFLLNQITTVPTKKPGFTKPPPSAKAIVQSDFEARKAELQLELDRLAEAEFQSKEKIYKKYADLLIKAKIKIDRDNTLRGDEAKRLTDLAIKVNDAGLANALKDFDKKQTDARKKINDELLALQNKNNLDQLNLLQDEFDRRAKLIDFNEKKAIEDSKDSTQKRLDALDLQRLLIGEQAYQDAKAIIISTGEQSALNIVEKFANERRDLAADIFQSLLASYDQAISEADLIRDEQQAKALQDLKRRFLIQEITYKEFQVGIKRIKDQHDRDMREGDLIVLKDQLAALDRKIAATEDKTSKHYANLLKQQKKFRKDIAAKESQVDEPPPPPEGETALDRFAKYAVAVGDLAAKVIGFWQQVNEAESAALDRSIALQEKRVDAAQRIAERGNAQYLKQEQDRLTELNVKRENAARKQLGVNAALQGSEILVALISGVAQGVKLGGPLGAIAAVGAVVAALAGAFAIAQSLKPPTPSFFVGTEDTGKGGKADSKGGFHAVLHPHERVLTAEENKKLKGISNRQLVEIVNRVKPVPLPNYERIKDAAEMHIGQDGRMQLSLSEQNKLIMENNDLQRATLKALKTIGVNVNMDKNGFAMSIMEVAEQIKINSRA